MSQHFVTIFLKGPLNTANYLIKWYGEVFLGEKGKKKKKKSKRQLPFTFEYCLMNLISKPPWSCRGFGDFCIHFKNEMNVLAAPETEC